MRRFCNSLLLLLIPNLCYSWMIQPPDLAGPPWVRGCDEDQTATIEQTLSLVMHLARITLQAARPNSLDEHARHQFMFHFGHDHFSTHAIVQARYLAVANEAALSLDGNVRYSCRSSRCIRDPRPLVLADDEHSTIVLVSLLGMLEKAKYPELTDRKCPRFFSRRIKPIGLGYFVDDRATTLLRELTRLSLLFRPPTTGERPGGVRGIWGNYPIDERVRNAYAYQLFVIGMDAFQPH